MAKIRTTKILARQLLENERLCYKMMVQRFGSTPLLQANLNVDAHFFTDYYNKQIQRIFECREAMSCHDGDHAKRKRGELTFVSTCKKRVCTGCARCRGVLQRHAYIPSIVRLQQQHYKDVQANKVGGESSFYFVTLTQPTVFCDGVGERIKTIGKEWRRLYMLTQKKSCKRYLSGLRTIEIELSEITPRMLTNRVEGYRKALKSNKVRASEQLTKLLNAKITEIEHVQNYVFDLKRKLTRIVRKGNIFELNKCDKELRAFWQSNIYKIYTYHPHMHIMVQGRDNANWLKRQWLKRFPDALSKSQKVIKVGESLTDEELEVSSGKMAKMLYEVTKYVTKTMGGVHTEKRNAYARALYWLHTTHLHGRKTFAAFGKVKKSSEKEVEAFFDEQKALGNYDAMNDDEELSTSELERIVKRVAYTADEDRDDLPGNLLKYSERDKNYIAEHIDKQSGEIQKIKLANGWDPAKDLTNEGKKIYLKDEAKK